MESTIKMPFTNLQQELLQLYAHEVSEGDLANIKQLIGKYFAQRLTQQADEAWEKNGWSQEAMDAILNDPEQ